MQIFLPWLIWQHQCGWSDSTNIKLRRYLHRWLLWAGVKLLKHMLFRYFTPTKMKLSGQCLKKRTLASPTACSSFSLVGGSFSGGEPCSPESGSPPSVPSSWTDSKAQHELSPGTALIAILTAGSLCPLPMPSCQTTFLLEELSVCTYPYSPSCFGEFPFWSHLVHSVLWSLHLLAQQLCIIYSPLAPEPPPSP